MRRLILTLCLLPCLAHAQGIPPASLPPGAGFVWEPVGDRGVSARDLQLTPDGAIWTVGPRVFRLDPTTQTWTQISMNVRQAVLVLPATATPADTLFISDSRGVLRSFDRGQTFVEVEPTGGETLAEAPSGALLVGGGEAPVVHRSADRGQTWSAAAFVPPSAEAITYALPLPPTPGAPARVLTGTVDGVAASDDGATLRPTGLWGGGAGVLEFGLTTSPATGARRVIAGGLRNAQPYGRAWYSDDDGATWAGEATFPDVADGGTYYQAVKAVVGLGDASALLILGRGAVYRTEDGGGSWALAGRTPIGETIESVGSALLGPDGRLYVGIARAGVSTPEGGWVYRTAEPIAVAAEGAPGAPVGLTLSAVPNPASGAAALTLSLPAGGDVRVALFDSLGREVAVLHEGPLAPGVHRLAVDTAGLAPGVYLARAETATGASTARLVVAH